MSVPRALGYDPRTDLFAKSRRTRIERDDHHAGQKPAAGNSVEHVRQHGLGEKTAFRRRQQARQPMLGAIELLHRNDCPDVAHSREASASAASTAAAVASSPSSPIFFAVGPLPARPPMMGDTATTGAPLALIASRMPGMARIGSMLMKGLDGQTITARTSPERSAAVMSACGWASVTPSKASSWTTGRHCWRTK